MTDVLVAGEFYSAFPERRINPFKPEVRMVNADDGQRGHIVGYASVFNKLSRKLGGFVEKVNPRAFTQSKTESWPDVVCRYNHNDDFLLGTTRAGTCMIDFDDTGLMYDVDPPSFRSDIIELCQRGDCQHSSFAFRVPDGGDDWSLSDFNYPLRTLLNVELVDVAPVITPAYPDATAALRAVDGAVQSLSHRFQAEPAEIRTLLAENMGVKLFKRSDRPSIPVESPQEEPAMTAEDETVPMTADELRADFIARAKELGLTDILPADWLVTEEESEARADAQASSDDDDDVDEDEDGEEGSGKGTEDQGRSDESDAEAREDVTADYGNAVEANGLSDNGHEVDSAAANRLLLASILEKRYDPFFFDSDDE